MILKFNKQIADIMTEEDSRCNWKTKLGLINPKQFDNATKTLMKIIDEEKAKLYMNHKDVDVLSIQEANQAIDNLYEEKHIIYNQTLVSANLTQKINNNEIDLNEMQPEWTPEQEAKWLYEKGISGIRKSKKPDYYTED